MMALQFFRYLALTKYSDTWLLILNHKQVLPSFTGEETDTCRS